MTEEMKAETVWDGIRRKLEELGVEVSMAYGMGEDRVRRVVGIGKGLKESLEELGESPRDQVLMVRVDQETCDRLDAWVESGVMKSRSEAAALFIREGMTARSPELAKLNEALSDVKEARERLRRRAREVFDEAPVD